MGKVHKGIPENYALKLAKIYKLKYFIETGTHTGRTAAWAADNFEYVLTIELDEARVLENRARYGHLRNINFLKGDSRLLLNSVLMATPGPAMIWLDAHWSRDLGYGRPPEGECPLMAEIDALLSNPGKHVILIDDARFFVGRPPKPHVENQWPVYNDIVQGLHPYWKVSHEKNLDIITALPVD